MINNENKNIVIVQRIFAIYRKSIFDNISTKFNLLVLHNQNNSGIKQISTDYSEKIRSIEILKKSFLFPFKKILKFKADVVIHENSIGILSLIPTIIFSKIFKKKIILWGHGFNHFKGFHPEKNIGDKLRLFLMKKADACLFYGNEGKKTISKYINQKKLFVAPNTLDTENLKKLKNQLDNEKLSEIKKEIGFKNKFNILFIGRLIKDKKPLDLITFYLIFKEKFDLDIGIHIIGNGEEIHSIRKLIKEKNISENFYLHGEIFDDNIISKYIFSSDLMFIPGYLGLSINHSFAFGCPVISFKSMSHSPEVEYIIQNKTGYLAKENDFNELTDWVNKFLISNETKTEFKNNIENVITNVCSIDNMLNGFIEIINYVTKDEK
jgi:1,2-diacylglycerol 3-alpha-glucosyltransferase